MRRDKQIKEPNPLSAAKPRTSKTYKKPEVHVVGKTASLIRGDYGKNNDKYARYED